MDDIKPINLNNTMPAATPSPAINDMESSNMLPPRTNNIILPILLILGIFGGLFLGYTLAKKQLLLAGEGNPALAGDKLAQNPESASAVKVGDVFGARDEKTFTDQAEGILQPGGIDGEGSHHIERGSNASQWVYVTSSITDLNNYVGHKVKVWGQTNAGKKAGWLMDVGRLEVLELNAAEINNIEAPLAK